MSVCVCVSVCVCTAELYINSCKFDSAYACIQEAANYNPVSHTVSYMVCAKMLDVFRSAVLPCDLSVSAACKMCCTILKSRMHSLQISDLNLSLT